MKKTASLVVIKGRRRIGKSRLATELAQRLTGYRTLKFQSLPPANLTVVQDREDFSQQIHRQLGVPAPRADDCSNLFKESELIFYDLYSTRDRNYREIVAALVDGSLDLGGLYATLGVTKTRKPIGGTEARGHEPKE